MSQEQESSGIDEISVLGRKIFFINPTAIVRSYVIRALRDKEYEAYMIENYRDAKPILHHNRNSICFVNVDTQLSSQAWIAFLETFQHDPVLRTVVLGLISKKVSQEEERAYFNNLVINAGILNLTGPTEEVFDKVKTVLDASGAMGNRKHIRVTCLDTNCKMYWLNNQSKMYKMKVVDVSTVSVAVLLTPELEGKIKERDSFDGVVLALNERQFTVGLLVSTLRKSPAGTVVIFKISDNSLAEMATSLKNHIYTMLDNHIKSIMSHSFQDETDYTMIAEQNRDIKMILTVAKQAEEAKKAAREKAEAELAEEEAKEKAKTEASESTSDEESNEEDETLDSESTEQKEDSSSSDSQEESSE